MEDRELLIFCELEVKLHHIRTMIEGGAHRWDRILKIGMLRFIHNGCSVSVITNLAIVKCLRQASVSEYPWVLPWHKETRVIKPQSYDNHYNYYQLSPVPPTPLRSALSYFPKCIEHLLLLYFLLSDSRLFHSLSK